MRHAFGLITWTAAALLGSLMGTARADDGLGAPLAAGVPVTSHPAASRPAGTKEAGTREKEIVKKRRYVAALIDSARDDIELGRLDLAQAKAAAVRKIQAAYQFLDDRATHVLVQIDRFRRPKTAATSARGADEPLVIRGQSPSGPDAPADFPPAVENAKQDSPPLSPTGSTPLTPKQQAKKLLAQARSAFDAGDYDEARTRALKADEFDVKWNILEDQPQTLLNEIERSTGTKILSRKSVKKQTPSKASDPGRAQALTLIRQARIDLQAGRFDAARKKALQAKQLNVVFGMFEDRPDTVLADTARAERALPAAASSDLFAPAASETTNPFGKAQKEPHNAAADAQKAQDLLRQARLDLKAGRLQAARRDAERAGKYNVAYSPFDDRPELVLESIAIREAQIGRSSGKEFGVEQAGAQSAPVLSRDGSQPVPQASVQTPEASESSSARKAKKERAQSLVQKARDDLKKGRIAAARREANEAAALQVTYSIMEDRPELILADIDRREPTTSVAGSGSPSGAEAVDVPPATDAASPGLAIPLPPAPPAAPVAVATPAMSVPPTSLPITAPPTSPFKTAEVGQPPQSLADGPPSAPTSAPFALEPAARAPQPPSMAAAPANPAEAITGENPFSAGKTEQAAVSVIRPSGVSADDLFDQGMQQLREGHTDAAYAAFLQCYHSGQQLDRVRQRQVQDFLRDLAPAHGRGVRQASAEVPATSPGESGRPRSASRIEVADQQRALKFEKLRTEALNAHFKAERLRESEPDKALKILADAIDNVEKSDLGTDAVAPLLHLLNRSKSEIEARQKQLAPVAAQQQHNRTIRSDIEIDQQYKIRVEQEFADLVDEYNKLVKQDRWAEAELIAKQAKELDKENPAAEIMFQKARIGKQVARNADLKIRKEDNFLEQLYEVEDAAASQMYGNPYKFPKDWNEITNRRKGKYGQPDNKERTEPEKQIEQSLSRPVSLHFNNEPLIKVIEEIQKIADVNVVLDNAGLEEERITSGTSVTIGVDGITLRSALNLILEPLNLGYMVHNEVLLITSRLKQQGKLEVRAYPVADLVLPIPNSTPTSVMQPGAGPQWSVPSASNTVPSSTGQAMMQVGQPLGSNPNAAVAASLGAARPNNAMGQPDFDSIKHLIIATIEPESWDETGGPGSMTAFESTLSLVIRQTQKVHDEIRDLLQQLRRLQDLQVTVECRFITVDDDFFESVGVDFNFNVQDNVSNSTLGLGRFGSPVFSGSSTSGTSSTSTTGTSSTSTTGTSSTSTTGTSSTSTSGVTSAGTPFLPFPFPLNLVNTGNWPSKGTIVGMDTPTTFSQDLNVPFRQGSFDIGIPQFGGFNPDAGAQVGMAILSDIEAFFFIRAAQGDTRTNVMFAPKVTLFNGQVATMQDSVERPFVTSVTPTVGVFAVGFTPQITPVQEGVIMTVAAVVSADRRFVRLSVLPIFTEITDVFTFTFVSTPGGTAGAQGLGPGATGSSGTTGTSGFGGGLSGTGSAGISGTATTGASTTGTSTTNLSAGNITVQQPVVERIVVQTTVSVPDGGTVLLGGIKRLREGRNEAGVPILGQIPYISRLFKNTGVGRETESLMLMVTPRIIIQEEEEELLESSAAQ